LSGPQVVLDEIVSQISTLCRHPLVI